MDKPANPGEVEDLIMQQYPSPADDAHAIGNYYDTSHHIHQLEQQSMDQSKMKSEAPPSPSHDQQDRPSVSAEELQLAARLTEGLAPMMAAAAAAAQREREAAQLEGREGHEVHESHESHEPSHDPNYPPETAPGLTESHAPPPPQTEQLEVPPRDPQAVLQSHEQPLQSRDYSQDSQNTSLQSHDQDIQMQDAQAQAQVHDAHQVGDVERHPDSTNHDQGDHPTQTHDGLPSGPSNIHSHVQMIHTQGHTLSPHDPNSLHTAISQHHDQQHEQQAHLQDPQTHQAPPQTIAAQYSESAASQAQLPPHQHQQNPQQQMAQIAQQAWNVDTSIPPRKRSKVSRACDECRRKKVKCDAISETGEQACTNCRRSQIRCDFSRIPQKRGPSKGYIKELADRINSIEGKLVGSQSLGAEYGLDLGSATQRRESADDYSPSTQLNENAKRPFSGISGDNFSTPLASAKQGGGGAGWSSEPRPIHPYPAPADRYPRPPFSVNDLAPRLAPAPEPGSPSRAGPMHAVQAPELDALPGADLTLPEIHYREIDDHVFHGYLTIIHPTFPFLAGVKAVVQSGLVQCPPVLQGAFTEALFATMQSFHAMPAGVTGDARSANRWLSEWELDAASATSSHIVEVVHLQTLLLLAMEADNHGPLALRGKHGGPSKTSFLARAVSVAYAMSLRSVQADASFDPESDPDADEKVALRAWWSLVALDRFNAIGTAQPLLIPQSGILPTSALRGLLGEAGYQFIKLTYVLGYYVEFLTATPSPISPPASLQQLPVSTSLAVGLEMWRMDFPGTITPQTHPVLHFAYWHCRLLAYLLQPTAKADDVLWAARSLLDDLAANHLALSPLNHSVTCLAAVCLVELARVDRTRDDATRLIASGLLGVNLAPSTWDGPIRDMISERATTTVAAGSSTDTTAALPRPLTSLSSSGVGAEATAAVAAAVAQAAAAEAAAAVAANQSLQHLADMAAATTGLQAVAAAVDAATETGGAAAAGEAATTAPATAAVDETPAAPQTLQPLTAVPTQTSRTLRPGDDYANLGFDPRPMLRAGYLYAVARPNTITAAPTSS